MKLHLRQWWRNSLFSNYPTIDNKKCMYVTLQGEVVLRKTLDYEKRDSYTFTVYVTDGRRNDSALINVSVLNINDWDPRFKYPQYEFHVKRDDVKAGHLVGKLDVYDGDKGDKTILDVRGPYARVFSIDQEGSLRIADLRYLFTFIQTY